MRSAVAVLVVAVLVSFDLTATALKPPSPSPRPPKPPRSSPRPAPPPAFPALTFTGCFDLVSEDGYIAAYDDKPSGVNLLDCYQWAISQLKPYFAITSYGECALGKTLGDFVEDDKDSTTLKLKIDSARCDAPCKGRTLNSPASQLKCGGSRNPDSGNIASVYLIDFSKVGVQVTPGTPGCDPVTPPTGPMSPVITSGKYRIRYIPYAGYKETYLGWTGGDAGIISDSILYAVDQTSPFYVNVEKRAAIPCSDQFYVWLTRTDASGVKFCVTYRDDTYEWEQCAAGSDAQLSILRPLAQPAGTAPKYELASKPTGMCLYPLKDASFTFTCGAIGAQLAFLPVA